MNRPPVSELSFEEFLAVYPRMAGADGEEDPAAPPADPPSYGPWITDLRTYLGDDDEVLAKADRYMRERVQPRSTELEQDVADYNRLRQDLAEDPEGTLHAVAEELWADDPDRVKAVAQALGITNEEAAEAIVAEEEKTPELPPEVQKLIEKQQQEELAEWYAGELAKTKAANADVDIDDDLFHPFVVSAGGEFDKALEGYKNWMGQVESKFKPAEPETPRAPAAVGSDATTTSTPPIQKKFGSFDEAMDAFMAEDIRPVGAS